MRVFVGSQDCIESIGRLHCIANKNDALGRVSNGDFMADDRDVSGQLGEEIQGAPPAVSSAELRARRIGETITVNRYLYQQTQQLEHMLLQAVGLQAVVEILLVTMPRHFSMRTAELWLYDPDGILVNLIAGRERYGQSLQLLDDVFPMQELYALDPDVELVKATDSRMFDILKAERGVEGALLVPLTESGRVVGSLHLGLSEDIYELGEPDQALMSHLALVLSACLQNAVKQEQITQLTLLDPLTGIANVRGFCIDLAREIARARRGDQPLTLLMLEIDDYDELYKYYGERRCHFVVRKVAERLSSGLRQTDALARMSPPQFAVTLPNTGEIIAQEVAERMRQDVEDFAIDDGRGAVLQVCLSIGLVTWEPQQYPAVDMPRLAQQMESVGTAGLEAAKSRGGNCVAHARLSTMMV